METMLQSAYFVPDVGYLRNPVFVENLRDLCVQIPSDLSKMSLGSRLLSKSLLPRDESVRYLENL